MKGGNVGLDMLMAVIEDYRKEVELCRTSSIREKLRLNGMTVASQTCEYLAFTKSKKNLGGSSKQNMEAENMLSYRIARPHCNLISCTDLAASGDIVNAQELLSSTIVFSTRIGTKSVVRYFNLPYVEKLPPYTTWIFLDKNRRMAEDQSVCGKRRIYYDQYGSETLICSDSEEDLPEKEDGKHEFTEGEDHILWNIMEKYGETVEVINSLCRCIKATYSEVKERFDFLKERPKTSRLSEENHDVLESKRSFILRKSLTAGLDSFDNLFCRHCLVFDCRLHRCSQGVIFPLEKLSCHVEEVQKPCSEWCYLLQMDNIDERAASDPASPCTEAVISLSSNASKAVEVSDHGGIGL